MNQELVQVKLNSLVNIDAKTVEEIIHISDDDVKWLKVTVGGFMDGNDFFAHELCGVIIEMKPYWISWEEGLAPEKISFTTINDQPDGFELRLDLKVLLRDGEIIGLSLAPSSARSFSRYMRRLQALKLPLTETLTTMRIKGVTNKKGQKFALVNFDFIPRDGQAIPKQSESVSEEEPPHPMEPPGVEQMEDIPF